MGCDKILIGVFALAHSFKHYKVKPAFALLFLPVGIKSDLDCFFFFDCLLVVLVVQSSQDKQVASMDLILH